MVRSGSWGLTRYVVEYVDCLMNWVQAMLDDEALFPSKIGTSPHPPFTSLHFAIVVNPRNRASESSSTRIAITTQN